MQDWSRNIESANRMIGKYGQQAALRRQGTPYGPAHAPTTPISFHSIVCVRLGAKKRPMRNGDPAASWSAEAKQEQLIVRFEEGVAPQIGDQLMMTGVQAFFASPTDFNFQRELTVEEVNPLQPAGVVILYELSVK